MKSPRRASNAVLTHYGRTSGKQYSVKLWFAEVDGEIWIGSLDASRSWVKNLRSGGRGELDLGDGPTSGHFEWVDDDGDLARFQLAVRAKYPIMARVLQYFVGGERCAFRVRLEGAGSADRAAGTGATR